MSDKKVIKELYLRNLTTDQSNYINALQEKFDERRGTEAARRALFSYFRIEGLYEEEKSKTDDLREELKGVKADLERLKSKVKNHFELEANLVLSKDTLLEVIKEPGKQQVIYKKIG